MTLGTPISTSRKVRRDRKPRAQRVCRECGAGFEIRVSQVNAGNGIFCSRECAGKSSGRKSGSPPVRRECARCGAEFVTSQGHVDAGGGLYCSRKCWGEHRTARSEEKKQGRSFVCQCCGKVFVDAYRKRQFCSNKCKGKSERKAVKAPSKRQWKHRKWARAVLIRDMKCLRCGATENLQAHHIKDFKSHPDLRYELSNGVALCVYCHHAQHPKQPLEQFTKNGGLSVRRCVVCEGPYLVPKLEQRTCSLKCGLILSYRRRKTINGD